MKSIKGWKFPIDVDKNTGKIMSLTNNDVIKQSVKMILQTQIHERKIFSNYGSNVRSFMFEVVDPSYISSFKRSVEDSISSCEPYVNEMNVSVSASNGPTSKITSEIEYTTDFSPEVEVVYKSISFSENA